MIEYSYHFENRNMLVLSIDIKLFLINLWYDNHVALSSMFCITVYSVANLNYAWFCLKAVCLSLERYSKNDGWMVIDCI